MPEARVGNSSLCRSKLILATWDFVTWDRRRLACNLRRAHPATIAGETPAVPASLVVHQRLFESERIVSQAFEDALCFVADRRVVSLFANGREHFTGDELFR